MKTSVYMANVVTGTDTEKKNAIEFMTMDFELTEQAEQNNSRR